MEEGQIWEDLSGNEELVVLFRWEKAVGCASLKFRSLD